MGDGGGAVKSVWQLEVERAADSYRAEAEQRRKLSPHDPAADALDYVARDLVERVRTLVNPAAMRTIEQYAAEVGVSAQTVRNWIRAGELEARPRGRTWNIPAGAIRRKRGQDVQAA